MKGAGVGGVIAKFQRSLLLYLDSPRARLDRALLGHPLGARTVGTFAMEDRHAAQTKCPCMRRRSQSYAYRDLPGPIRDCGRVTSYSELDLFLAIPDFISWGHHSHLMGAPFSPYGGPSSLIGVQRKNVG